MALIKVRSTAKKHDKGADPTELLRIPGARIRDNGTTGAAVFYNDGAVIVVDSRHTGVKQALADGTIETVRGTPKIATEDKAE